LQSVAIVGVGLIGGSFALALRRAGFGGEIWGVSSALTIEKALEKQIIDRGLTLEAAARADLVFLATPIGTILESLPHLQRCAGPNTLITDAGSTKRQIAERARGLRFLGGHPMAGKETSGLEQAEPGLFDGRPWILTPEGPVPDWADQLADLLTGIGARVHWMSPPEHDRWVAACSHLPQLTSTALALALSRFQDAPSVPSGPGLRDMLRLAESPWDLWRDILATNADEVKPMLDRCIEELGILRETLEKPDLANSWEEARRTAVSLRYRNS
jgi:prephenate dehydrogenase